MHATQRNATQRNATQRNATQRNATYASKFLHPFSSLKSIFRFSGIISESVFVLSSVFHDYVVK